MKNFSKRSNFIIILTFLFIAIFTLSIFTSIPLSFADEITTPSEEETPGEEIPKGLIVETYDRDGNEVKLTNTSSYDGGTNNAYRMNWADITRFTVYYSPDIENPPQKQENAAGEIVYNLSISIDYLQGYIDTSSFSNNNNVINLDDLFTMTKIGEDSYTSFITNKYNFFVDTGESGQIAGQVKTIKEWGIYRFRLSINGDELTSDFYVVEPDYSISRQPEVGYKLASSINSMHDAFDFYLNNASDYKYIDKSRLKWYVKGIGKDETTYALVEEDLSKINFSECTNALYPTYERTGTTFYFNDNEKAGKWDVWCEYQSVKDPLPVTSDFVVTVETGTNIDLSLIIILICVAVVVAITIVIIVAAVKSKKEKVW